MINLVIGVALIAVAFAMFWGALPKEGGVVRPFLRKDFMQGIYSISIVFIGTVGAFTSVLSLYDIIN